MGDNTYPARRRRHRRRRRAGAWFVPLAVIVIAVLLAAGMWRIPDEAEDNNITSITDVPDRAAPVITGVRNLMVYEGDTISYRGGITVTDDQDVAPVLDVDASAVDLTKVGTYEIRYTATDAAGNTAGDRATVTVLEKGADFVDTETIYAAADEVLETLIWDGATPEAQARAIYDWARSRLSYGGHSDRSDWMQAGYAMLTGGRGDCFGYFAVTKLMLERLGIPNIDVCKVKNSDEDSDHFWSLVSVDGGETYYHFDATPRFGSGDSFCLVTDEYLDDYSEENDGSHNRDKTLYPQTPKEAL